MDGVLQRMCEIYGELCWMEGIISKRNPLTFHHIQKKCDGGKRIISNGAVLSKQEHDYLNQLELRQRKLYVELNWLFQELNRTYAPPTKEYYEELHHLLSKSYVIKRR